MKTGILVTSRLGSTRLKKKHLLEVNGKPILYYLLSRLISEFKKEIEQNLVQVVIATSDESENQEFEGFGQFGAGVFYGSINNIPLRHLQTAKALEFDNIISIDGDDILCSVTGARSIYETLKSGAKYVKTINLPFGMNSAGYTTIFLEDSLAGNHGDFLETGWGRIFDPEQIVEVDTRFPVNNDSLRFTLDYEMDFVFFKAIIEDFREGIITASDKDIVDLVISRELYKLNESISQAYWQNFSENVAKEQTKND